MNWSGGDWLCGACEHQNFKKRETCQRCSYPKFGGPDVSTYQLYNRTDQALPGDWYCSVINCGSHNYASRTTCYRCGSFNAGSGGGGVHSPAGWKTGDWICTRYGCGLHNYANRVECYKCKTPRDSGAANW